MTFQIIGTNKTFDFNINPKVKNRFEKVVKVGRNGKKYLNAGKEFFATRKGKNLTKHNMAFQVFDMNGTTEFNINQKLYNIFEKVVEAGRNGVDVIEKKLSNKEQKKTETFLDEKYLLLLLVIVLILLFLYYIVFRFVFPFPNKKENYKTLLHKTSGQIAYVNSEKFKSENNLSIKDYISKRRKLTKKLKKASNKLYLASGFSSLLKAVSGFALVGGAIVATFLSCGTVVFGIPILGLIGGLQQSAPVVSSAVDKIVDHYLTKVHKLEEEISQDDKIFMNIIGEVKPYVREMVKIKKKFPGSESCLEESDRISFDGENYQPSKKLIKHMDSVVSGVESQQQEINPKSRNISKTLHSFREFNDDNLEWGNFIEEFFSSLGEFRKKVQVMKLHKKFEDVAKEIDEQTDEISYILEIK